MRELIALVQEYATAHGAAERHRALLECLIDDNDGFLAAKIAEYEGAATTAHARLMTAYDQLTRTTVRAVADEQLPVCTWQKGVVEARGVLPDATRSVRVRYTPGQAIAAGAALIACAALADRDTGGTLTPLLPPFPINDLGHDSTAAGTSTKDTES
uniref:hypothetical protein n=1 Tax=Paractinoplanes polyasparticus TaxID=2856853 RepID=UPI001C864E45|nr:hypothetical protein [Actinoplanes polyasparticus]